MKEIEHVEPMSDMAKSLQGQAQDLLRMHITPPAPAPAPKHKQRAEAGKSLIAKALSGLTDLVKAQVQGYTKKDGTVVSQYSSKVMAAAHPSKGYKVGANVYHPHPDKAGKKGLGKYLGHTEDGSQSVVEHGGKQYAVPHDQVKAASGVPGGSAKEAPAASAAAAAKAPAAAPAAAAPVQRDDSMPADGGSGVDPKALDQMASTLANDEDSSDDELIAFFTKECGVDPKVAAAAVSARGEFEMATPAGQNPQFLGSLIANAMKKAGGGAGAKPAPTSGGEVPEVPRETPGAGAGAAPAGGEVPPQADANIDSWDNLPDDENPRHAMSGMGSKDLGALATMKPEHAKAHAHQELVNRGQDSQGNWKGFEQAKAHHQSSIPSDFTPHPSVTEGMQAVKGKVLQAAAGGHLDLQQRARAHLAGRGHDTQGNWVGFQKANELHGMDGKTGKPLAKGGGKPAADMTKSHRPMFFVSSEKAAELKALAEKATGGKK